MYRLKTGINHGCNMAPDATPEQRHGCRHEAGEVLEPGHLTEAEVRTLANDFNPPAIEELIEVAGERVAVHVAEHFDVAPAPPAGEAEE